MFKEFKPQNNPASSRENISNMFQKGDFHTAPQVCRKSGYKITEFQADIEIGARKMLLSHRVGELLSFIYKYEVQIKI